MYPRRHRLLRQYSEHSRRIAAVWRGGSETSSAAAAIPRLANRTGDATCFGAAPVGGEVLSQSEAKPSSRGCWRRAASCRRPRGSCPAAASLHSACEGSRSGAARPFHGHPAYSVTPGPRRCDVQARQTRPGAIRHQVLIFVSRGAMPGPIDDPKRWVTRRRQPMALTASDRTEEMDGKEALRDRARRTLPGP